MCDFEKKVITGLENCGVVLNKNTGLIIGAAVSGGADSVSLLISLSNICSTCSIPLKVITVNHNIRPEEETKGDAEYVVNLCKKLKNEGKDIECIVKEIPKGQVQSISINRKQGIEDAARFLRYQAFESFINEYNISFLCLAHNKNDQLETILMRFLQGASCESSAGIQKQRGKFIRPLMEIERTEIEAYLKNKNIIWRTDSTNFETEYLRNKIRLKLVPFLDKEFGDWKKALLSGAEKALEDSEVISTAVNAFPLEEKNGGICINSADFKKLPVAIKKRVLLKAFNMCGENKRIPSAFLDDVIQSLSSNSKSIIKKFGSVILCVENKIILIKKDEKIHTDIVFFDIIEESGLYDFPFGQIRIEDTVTSSNVNVYINSTLYATEIKLPFCIRSIQLGDVVKTSYGQEKKVADILSDWHVCAEHRKLIPVLQLLEGDSQQIKCVFGSFLGYKDWIVK